MEINKLYNCDCMTFMKTIPDKSIDLILTDIPYDGINRQSNGLRNLDKGNADISTFDILDFAAECYRIAKSTIIIFCGVTQISSLYSYFYEFQKKKKGTARQLVYCKTNPSPMNGKYIYLSAIENAIWFRKSKGTFNGNCKKNYFIYPQGSSKLHPTQKNSDLIKELILDNSNEGDLIFDPCAGSGTHLLIAKEQGRNYLGCELDKDYYEIAIGRFNA